MQTNYIKVTWIDSNIYERQNALAFDYEIPVIETMGYLVSKDKDKIVVARDVFIKEKDARGVIAIPRECVKQIIFLTEIKGGEASGN